MRSASLRMGIAALVIAPALVMPLAAPLGAQAATGGDSLTVARIFSNEFSARGFGQLRWIEGGTAFITVDPAAGGKGREIVRHETATDAKRVLVTAAQLTPPGDTMALSFQSFAWSDDNSKLLLFTNTRKVWRQNTRGDYWVLDRPSGKLRKLGGDAPASSLMFATFSPDGSQVAYVRENDMYVETIGDGRIVRLTSDGSRTSINGTSDWVYEEELGIRKAFDWSPDGKRVAFWHFDASPVRDFLLINDTDSLYPVHYPHSLSQGRHHQLAGHHRRGPGRGRRRQVDGRRGRYGEELHRRDGVARSELDHRPASQPEAEPERFLDRRRHHRPGQGRLHRQGRRLGGRRESGAPLDRQGTLGADRERAGRLAARVPHQSRRRRSPEDHRRRLRRDRHCRRGREGEGALRDRVAHQRHAALPLPRAARRREGDAGHPGEPGGQPQLQHLARRRAGRCTAGRAPTCRR